MAIQRAEILVNGFVQGVGFRYFVARNAEQLLLKGFTKNLFSGEVYTVVEGELAMIEELYKKIKIGPTHADIKNASIKWSEPKNEFTIFEIRY
ncbi:MAG: acylphosphatase [Ignavibacteriales bacterium]|nr:acylphosphatase [Ignavibacteriales bacterium]